MTENYVTFQIAELLKEKGFDEICHSVYDDKDLCSVASLNRHYDCGYGDLVITCKNTDYDDWENKIAAPTVQMANQFLREKYHLHISIGFINYGYSWHIINCEYGNCYSHGQKGGFKTAEDANIDALNICLTDIIK